MIILVGLTDDCPTEEDIEVWMHQGWIDSLMMWKAEDGTLSYFEGLASLREWADENYNIWTLKGL